VSLRARLGDWLEDRAGARSAARWALDEPVPGGARFAYVFGSTLLVLVLAQVATGFGLALYYSPSEASAWSSVFWIQTQVTLGWLLRGLHHHGASVAIVVAGLHLGQTLLFGAYRKPRELTWMVGVLLLLLLLAFALTGYLLPWDQRGYWATRVATSMAGTVPVVGGHLERVAQGGEGYGTLTLTRFYALHAVLLPLLFLGLVGVHVALFRRRGVTPSPAGEAARAGPAQRVDRFWPHQAARDALVAAAALLVVLALSVRGHGAPLEAPADPSLAPLPRPEWYFLGLFQLQKVFQGPLEPVGTFVLPGLATAALLLLPFLDRARGRSFRERRAVLAVAATGALAYAGLTVAAVVGDARDTRVAAARVEAERTAARAKELAARGIPPEGPAFMVANDPPERGRRLFGAECAGCHTIGGGREYKAPDLAGLFSLDWVKEQIRDPDQLHRFGATKLKGKMDTFGRRLAPERIDALARFVQARRDPARAEADPSLEEGRRAFARVGCTECHSLSPGEPKDGPNLYDYGSDRYLRALLEDPGAPLHFGRLNGMPAMRTRLTPEEIAAVMAYLRTLEPLPVHHQQQQARR
jgi:ubiquinol-cytochrome c reductase cytochrome b subunit